MRRLLLLLAILATAGCATVVTTHVPDSDARQLLTPSRNALPPSLDASTEAIEIFAGEPR